MRRGAVFPAWAGVDLKMAQAINSSYGIPRVGGGRPKRARAIVRVSTYSPRGRG